MDAKRSNPSGPTDDEPLRSTELTWVALLGRWLEFARASVALPDDARGRRWRASIAPVINLQAVTFALGQLDDLPGDERALGLDRAEILIRRASVDLDEAWREAEVPPLVSELIEDATRSLVACQTGPFVEFLVPGSISDDEGYPIESTYEMPSLAPLLDWCSEVGFTGDLRAAAPGTLLLSGEPAVHFTEWPDRCSNPALGAEGFAALVGRRVVRHSQIYRVVDDAGRIIEDRLLPLDSEPIAGRPLVLAVLEAGEPVPGRPSVDAVAWADRQRAAWPDRGLRVIRRDDRPISGPEESSRKA